MHIFERCARRPGGMRQVKLRQSFFGDTLPMRPVQDCEIF
jgi:hypothetical protein